MSKRVEILKVQADLARLKARLAQLKVEQYAQRTAGAAAKTSARREAAASKASARREAGITRATALVEAKKKVLAGRIARAEATTDHINEHDFITPAHYGKFMDKHWAGVRKAGIALEAAEIALKNKIEKHKIIT